MSLYCWSKTAETWISRRCWFDQGGLYMCETCSGYQNNNC